MSEEVKQQDTFKLRLNQSSTIVSLMKEQVWSSQYLLRLISTSANDKGEYILSNFIRYHAFNTILASVTAKRTSFLLSKLPKKCNPMYMIRLYQYLSIDPSFLDLDAYRNIDFDAALIPQRARDFAVEAIVGFVIVSRNHHDALVEESMMHLMETILSNVSIFGRRLRYHTFVIAQAIFDSKQIAHLRSFHSIVDKSNEDISDAEEDEEPTTSPVPIILNKKSNISPIAENLVQSTETHRMLQHIIPLLYLSMFGTIQDQDKPIRRDYLQQAKSKSARADYFNVFAQQSNVNRCKDRLHTKRRYYQ